MKSWANLINLWPTFQKEVCCAVSLEWSEMEFLFDMLCFDTLGH